MTKAHENKMFYPYKQIKHPYVNIQLVMPTSTLAASNLFKYISC